MSERYEAVLFSTSRGEAERAFRLLRSPLPVGLGALARDLFAVYVREGRIFDPPEVEAIAARLSKTFGKALALFHDDSCGVDVAACYEGGRLTRRFDESSQIWLLLNDAGGVDLEAGRFSAGDVAADDDPEREFLCFATAIDAGLAEFGFDYWFDAGLIKQKIVYKFEY